MSKFIFKSLNYARSIEQPWIIFKECFRVDGSVLEGIYEVMNSFISKYNMVFKYQNTSI